MMVLARPKSGLTRLIPRRASPDASAIPAEVALEPKVLTDEPSSAAGARPIAADGLLRLGFQELEIGDVLTQPVVPQR